MLRGSPCERRKEMIELVIGRMGSGKTLYVVIEADAHRKKHPYAKMVGNFGTSIPGWTFKTDPVAEMGVTDEESFKNSLWVIDSISHSFDNRSSCSSKLLDDLLVMDAAIGHGARILATAQDSSRLRLDVIDKVDILTKCEYDHESKVLKVSKPQYFANLDRYYNLFNTMAAPQG